MRWTTRNKSSFILATVGMLSIVLLIRFLRRDEETHSCEYEPEPDDEFLFNEKNDVKKQPPSGEEQPSTAPPVRLDYVYGPPKLTGERAGRCGQKWQADCPSNEPCCAKSEWCGVTKSHCKCKTCIDFRDLYSFESTDNILHTRSRAHAGTDHTIWQFWEGPHVPGFVQLCQETVWLKNPNLRLEVVNDNRLRQLFSDLHPRYMQLTPTHRSDYARCRLLSRYGGMWADVDTIALNSWRWLFDAVHKGGYHLAKSQWENEVIAPISNLGPMIPDAPGIRECTRIWHQLIDEQVSTEKGDQILLAANAPTVLDPFTALWKQANHTEVVKVFDLGFAKDGSINGSYMFPDVVEQRYLDIAWLLWKGRVRRNQVAIVLINHAMQGCYKQYSHQQAACSRRPLSRLLRALGAGSTVDCSLVKLPDLCENRPFRQANGWLWSGGCGKTQTLDTKRDVSSVFECRVFCYNAHGCHVVAYNGYTGECYLYSSANCKVRDETSAIDGWAVYKKRNKNEAIM